MAKMTAGRAVVESLIAQGVDTVFGIVSIHTLYIYDALRDAVAERRLRFVGARHEHALGFMADGYARVTGRPGVMLTSGGPGAADSVGALGESYHSSVPLLQVTAEIENEWVGRALGVTHEAKDQMGMFASVSDWRRLVRDSADISNAIAEGFEHLRTHHPRPAVLAVPTDLLGVEDDYEIIPSRDSSPPEPPQGAVAEAMGLVASARRPVIIAGGGVNYADASAELRELAEHFDIPVAAADGGKGAFPEDHPLALGTALGGRVWGDNPVQEYIASCDVALVVGSSLPFRSTKGVGLRLPECLVQIDIDPAVFGRNYPVKVGLPGHAKAALRAMLDAAQGSRRAPAEEKAALAHVQDAIRQSVERQFSNELRVWQTIRRAIDRDAAVFCDSTIPGYVATRCFQALGPRTFHQPHGWVSIGYAFAASLGAKAAAPDRQVVCVTGDGGFQYNVQELASARQYGLAPIVLVFNDNAWGVLKRYQDTRFSGRHFATDLMNPDFEVLAAAYGVDYSLARNVDELGATLQQVRGRDKLQLIEVCTPEGIASFR